MNATTTLPTPPAPAKNRQRVRTPGGACLGQDASRDAKRLAAAVLEVLAGTRTPGDAAAALGVSLPRYYQVESRALAGLLAACEPRPKGRVRSPQHEIDVLRRREKRLQHELSRYQALLRAAHKTVGLASVVLPAPGKSHGKTNGKRRRRPTARALSVAARWQAQQADQRDAAGPSQETPVPQTTG